MCREGGVTSECERDERRGEEIMRQRKENESRRERKTSNEQVDHREQTVVQEAAGGNTLGAAGDTLGAAGGSCSWRWSRRIRDDL